MFLKLVIFACALVGCSAKQVAPPAPSTSPQPGPVRCVETPSNIFLCIGNINVIKNEVSKKCNRGLSKCDTAKCLFRESGWALPGDKANKQKMAEYFTQYAVDHPEWSAAVQNLKANCLGDKEISPQGVYLDCAPYDVLHCIITSFLKSTAPGQWSTSPECKYPRDYAQSCPYCPDECFAPAVPYGSCNACHGLPNSP